MNIIEWRDSLYESNLSYKAKLVGAILSQFYRTGNPTYPAVRTLSQLTSLTINPVQDGLAELEKEGYISRKQERIKGNKYLSNIYTFIDKFNKVHVSPHDTSRDDTSRDDTSYDTSRGDTEVDEVDEVEKIIPIKKKPRKKDIINSSKPENVSLQIWNDFEKLRVKKSAPITDTALSGIIKEANKANFTLEEALQECCIRGWQSFKAEWVKPKEKERIGLKIGDRI